ncbi:MAG: SDR family NAD(P)-dependent oxidoreductase [Methanobacteriota archaeon]|nr:MAG: SDR family NAD(P)-dependent oxidoreductase [Euryarchaeota archaeon]
MRDMNEKKLYALIIGASGGIGKEFATFLKQRFNIIETFHSNSVPQGFELDFNNPQTIDRFADSLSKKGIRINLIINASGVYSTKKLLQSEVKDFCETLLANVIGFNTLLTKILHLLDEHPTLIFCGSDAGISFQAGHPLYSLSKWMLESYAENLSHEMPKSNIVVLEFGNLRTNFANMELENAMDPKTAVQEAMAKIENTSTYGLKRIFVGNGDELDYAISDMLERLVEIKRHLDSKQKKSFEQTVEFFWDLLME